MADLPAWLVRELLDAGARSDLQGDRGLTAQAIARQAGHAELTG